MDTMIRNIPDAQHERVQQIARQRGVTQNDIYLQAIAAHLDSQDPQLCLGWIKIDRPGDADECVECRHDLADSPAQFVALMADGSAHGPVCNVCAT